MGMQTGSFSLIKRMNTTLILNVIREKGNISRADISKIIDLTPATVTNITAELIERGIIAEAEYGESKGGRKPVMLTLNSKKYVIAGVYIGSEDIIVIQSDLSANILRKKALNISPGLSGDEVLSLITDMISDMPIGEKNLLAIGVGVHGLVKMQEGISVFSPSHGWENVRIKDVLESEFNVPVYVENDVRTMTLGESWFGIAQDVSNFAYVYVGFGIGGSLVFNNELYRGSLDGAGEFGHTTIEVDGPLCRCGNHGCLQALASGEALLANARKAALDGNMTELMKACKNDVSLISIDLLLEHLNTCAEIKHLVKANASYLGVGIANIINSFNPSLVVVNGHIIKFGSIVMKEIIKEVQRRGMKYLQNSVGIKFSPLGGDAVLKGSVALALMESFKVL